MSREWWGISIVVAGAVLVLVAALADVMGIGDRSGFGLRQIAGVAVGVLAVIVGVLVVGRRPA